jgi:hypothetical protein
MVTDENEAKKALRCFILVENNFLVKSIQIKYENIKLGHDFQQQLL